MKRDDWMLLTLTFLTGLAIGMYVYIAAFKPLYVPEDLGDTEAAADEWSVVGKQRSDEDNSYIQPSFRVLADGSYTYLPGGSGDDALEPIEGKLSRSLLRDLQVTEFDLEVYAKRVTGVDCESDEAGYDYRYRFTLNGEDYLLDTCYTVLGYNSDLATALEEVWNILDGTDGGRSYDSTYDLMQDWIRRNFAVDGAE